jgi:hypothetical protein
MEIIRDAVRRSLNAKSHWHSTAYGGAPIVGDSTGFRRKVLTSIEGRPKLPD